MKFCSQIFIATLLVALTVLSDSEAKKPKTDYNQLTTAEKLLLEIRYPELAKSLHINKNQQRSPLSYNGYAELLILDGPTYFQVLAGLGNSVLLPDLFYEFRFEYCYIGFCIGFDDFYDLRGLTVDGTVDTTLKTSINGTRLQVEYISPKVQFHGPSTSVSNSAMPYTSRTTYRGVDVSIRNYTFGFSGDVILGSEGLRVSNVDFHLGLRQSVLRWENATVTYTDGRDDEHQGPSEVDSTEYVQEAMAYLLDADDGGLNLKQALTIWLNCFLSNGETGDAECSNYLSDRSHRQSFVQLVHGIGLGQLLLSQQ